MPNMPVLAALLSVVHERVHTACSCCDRRSNTSACSVAAMLLAAEAAV
jgi:hypothetical protein